MENPNSKIEYSEVEISLEMLNQAFKAGYKPMTTKGLAMNIMNWREQHPDELLPYRYHAYSVVDELEKSTEKSRYRISNLPLCTHSEPLTPSEKFSKYDRSN